MKQKVKPETTQM